jgi:hypothetical protein
MQEYAPSLPGRARARRSYHRIPAAVACLTLLLWPTQQLGVVDHATVEPGVTPRLAAAAPSAGPTVATMAASPIGNGWWVLLTNGAVQAHGDVPQLGDLANRRLNATVVGIAATPTGEGYWLVAADGGIFTFGDAAFHGSTGAMRLNQPLIGMTATPSGNGYWELAADGGIFSFGVPFYGSTGDKRLDQPVVGMLTTPSGKGYRLVTRNGTVHHFGDATDNGSDTGTPTIGLAPRPNRQPGYLVIDTNGNPHEHGTTASAAPGTGMAGSSSGASAPAGLAFGVNVHTLWDSSATYPAEYDLFSSVGSRWIRTDVYWDGIEPSGKGSYDNRYLQQIDAAVEAAGGRGMQQLLVVLGTPTWARRPGFGRMSAPARASDYADVMEFLSTRYRGRGVAFELWNEPNESRFFAGADPAAYSTLACDAYASIKRADSTATVLAGAISGEDHRWLSNAYANGLAGCFDALSVHPYLNPPRTATGGVLSGWEPRTNTLLLHDIMRSNGDDAKKIWFTEFGWASDPRPGAPPFAKSVTPTEQADLTVRFLDYVNTSLPFVQVAIAYEGKDEARADGAAGHYGLLQADLTPKPVVGALRDRQMRG